jgi:hypothetical protein
MIWILTTVLFVAPPVSLSDTVRARPGPPPYVQVEHIRTPSESACFEQLLVRSAQLSRTITRELEPGFTGFVQAGCAQPATITRIRA